jgi:hypothetical protein
MYILKVFVQILKVYNKSSSILYAKISVNQLQSHILNVANVINKV